MTTQEQVNALQADLLAAETAINTVMQAIIDAASLDSAVTPQNFHKLVAGQNVTQAGMAMFHEFAAKCSIDAGITPLSGGGPKN